MTTDSQWITPEFEGMCHLDSSRLPLRLAEARQREVDLVGVEGGRVGSRCCLHF